jgi:aspartate/methionine/tyrosine aminotransferase
MNEPADLQHWVDIYADNRNRLIQGLASMGIDKIASPDGAFYLYADVGHITKDSHAFCIACAEQTGVGIAPGIDFDLVAGNRFIRLSFAVLPDEIEQAIESLRAWLPMYKSSRERCGS